MSTLELNFNRRAGHARRDWSVSKLGKFKLSQMHPDKRARPGKTGEEANNLNLGKLKTEKIKYM